MKTELFTVIILGVVIAVFTAIAGNHILWGILILLINSVWYIISKKQLRNLKDTKYNSNCYEYLIEISEKIKNIARINKRNTIFSIPLILFPILVYTYYNNQDKTLGQILGIDTDLSKSYIFILIPVVTLITYGLYLIYLKFNNRIGNKIETLILDMEDLRE
jgi:predicted secreted protein